MEGWNSNILVNGKKASSNIINTTHTYFIFRNLHCVWKREKIILPCCGHDGHYLRVKKCLEWNKMVQETWQLSLFRGKFPTLFWGSDYLLCSKGSGHLPDLCFMWGCVSWAQCFLWAELGQDKGREGGGCSPVILAHIYVPVTKDGPNHWASLEDAQGGTSHLLPDAILRINPSP